ncbi:MAG: MFS transporter [Pseudomonadota bacterium]
MLANQPVMRRGPATWYAYISIGIFTFFLVVQGNVLPLVKQELNLSYGVASLHSSAIALGMIAVGLWGERLVRRWGQLRVLNLGLLGAAAGAVLLSMAPVAWMTIGSCALIGAFGALVPAVNPTILAALHPHRRDVAITEAAVVCYGFAILAPLLMSLSIAWFDGWRPVLLVSGVFAAAIALAFRRTTIVEPPRFSQSPSAGLPVAFWAYWGLLALVVAIELCILIWAPTFLGEVAGMPLAQAAWGAAAFSVAMLIGRLAGSALVRHIRSQHLVLGALIVTALAFPIYWHADRPWPAIAGLFGLGLGVALLYPLSVGMAIGAAGDRASAAGARFMLAAGLALLLMPFALGALGDQVGIHIAHLIVPILVTAALILLGAARILERRSHTRTA